MPIESSSAYAGQVTHPLNPWTALQRHYVPDAVVNASSPDLLFSSCRTAICCKAPLKKSTSKTFSASKRFRSRISLRNLDSRDFANTGSSPSSAHSLFLYHRYRVCLATPSSFAKCSMFSQHLKRSTAIRWNVSDDATLSPCSLQRTYLSPRSVAFRLCHRLAGGCGRSSSGLLRGVTQPFLSQQWGSLPERF